MELYLKNKTGLTFLVNPNYKVHRHMLLQAVVLLISVGVFFDAPDTLNLTFDRVCGWFTYFLFLNMLVYVNVYFLFPRFLAKDKIGWYALSLLTFTFISLLIVMALQRLFYTIAVVHQEPSTIALFLSICSSFLAIMLFIAGTSTLLLFKPLLLGKLREQTLQTATTESELKYLKGQINPHFLFNTVNNANILIEDEPDMASAMLLKLDSLLHYQLADSAKEKVFLQDDIQFLRSYLDLEQVRRDSFNYTIVIDGEVNELTLAPLLFIPFVENAVKHNAEVQGRNYIHVSFVVKAKSILFTCENSSSSKPPPAPVGGLGLNNIQRRLDLLYGDHYLLQQDKTEDKYTVKLTLAL